MSCFVMSIQENMTLKNDLRKIFEDTVTISTKINLDNFTNKKRKIDSVNSKYLNA